MVEFRRLVVGLGWAVGVAVSVMGVLLLVAFIRAATLEDFDYEESKLDLGARENLPSSYLKKLPKLMARALSIPTVSISEGNYDVAQLEAFHTFLRESFPHVFNSSFIHVEVVNKLSLLLTVKGFDKEMDPYLLMGHMDVVPVDEEKWTHDPWGGHIIPDPTTGKPFIWGRGAIDDKIAVMGIMSSLQYLAQTGFEPARTFFVAFGHDEEVRGDDGAGHIAKVLKERGVQLDFILDEGLPVISGVLRGVPHPVAGIGVTEKGWLEVELEAEGEGGHSSMPPAVTAVTRLTDALQAIHAHPHPSMFGLGPEADLLAYVAPKASWPHKLVFANLWLFGPLLSRVLSASRDSNALVRTTTCVTIVNAGVKSNVVPTSARAVINHRVHPAHSMQDAFHHDRRVIVDPNVKVKILNASPPAPVSPYGPDVPAWRLLTAAIHHHFPGAITAPGVLVGNTDTRHFLSLSRHIYRFNPVVLTKAGLNTIHGHDEKLSSEDFITAVKFYYHLILSADLVVEPLSAPIGHKGGEL